MIFKKFNLFFFVPVLQHDYDGEREEVDKSRSRYRETEDDEDDDRNRQAPRDASPEVNEDD